MMVPAAAVETVVDALSPHLQPGDILVDGGNSHYIDDIRRAKALTARGIHYVDVGVSGGVRGGERGYCLMIGGAGSAVAHLEPIFRTLAPGVDAAALTPGARRSNSTAEDGYLHCGAAGAGHFVKMVHNGIEYALMAAYAEGFNLLAHAGAGLQASASMPRRRRSTTPSATTTTSTLADVAEVWRRGSVIGSWLLDLTAAALAEEPDLRAVLRPGRRFRRGPLDGSRARSTSDRRRRS